jgi:ABC-type Fe3+ transport system permease subunit
MEPEPKVDPEAVLQAEISRYVLKGYRVTTKTARSAQLLKPKKFSVLWAMVWLLLVVLPFVLYLVWYGVKRDEHLYLTVDEEGKITTSFTLAS